MLQEARSSARTHCRGECGYPALFFRQFVSDEVRYGAHGEIDGRPYFDYKCHGVMVARGRVWQTVWQDAWVGPRVYLGEEWLTEEVFNLWWT